ncbi:MAG TPA: MFS transporter [Ktedonobacterales bacterium]|nr:MFS transporter [Ktedonobacterales bacterium]
MASSSSLASSSDSPAGAAPTAPALSARAYGWMLALTIVAGVEVGLLLLDISPILPLVRQQYAVSYVAAGWAISATIVSHTLTVALAGFIAGRIGPRVIVLAGMMVLAASAVVRALASSFSVLVASRALTGIGTGCVIIGGITAITLLSPPVRRVRDQGYFGAAQQLGVMLTLLVVPVAIPVLGGRAYWGLLAAELTLVLALCLVRYPAWRQPAHRQPRSAATRAWPGLLLRDGYGWLLSLANMAGYGVFVGVTAWTASFFVERFHTSPHQTALLTAAATLFACIGRLAASPLLRVVSAHWLISGFVTLTAASLLAVPFAPTREAAAALFLGFALGSSVPFGAVFGSVADRLQPAGLSVRIMLITFNSNLVALFLPVVIGFVVSLTGSFSASFWLTGALVGIVAFVLGPSSVGRGQREVGLAAAEAGSVR